MKFRSMLAVAALSILCSSAHAAVRTFTVNSSPSLSNVTFNFELDPTALSNGVPAPDQAYGTEILTPNSVAITGGNAPFSLHGVNHSTLTDYFFHFQGTGGQIVYVFLNDAPFTTQPSGADIPDGTDPTALVFFDNNGSYSTDTASVTIGTVAVPEPSAFAFGGLAVVATGIGRWLRRRKTAA